MRFHTKPISNILHCTERQGYFLIVPLLLTALCASGFQRMDYNYDPEYLLSPSTGPAKQERATMETQFPIDYEYFQVRTISSST